LRKRRCGYVPENVTTFVPETPTSSRLDTAKWLDEIEALGPVKVSDPVKRMGACVPELFSPVRKMCPLEKVTFSATVFPLRRTMI
jgi:hypothetical protein